MEVASHTSQTIIYTTIFHVSGHVYGAYVNLT
jgi:hypothetical protein